LKKWKVGGAVLFSKSYAQVKPLTIFYAFGNIKIDLKIYKIMEIKPQKKYKKVEANLLRTLFNRERQLLQAQRLTRELWNLLKEVKPSK